MTVELLTDNASTTLTSSPGIGATSFTVASSAGFPAAVTGVSQFRVIIGTELITVTNVSGTTWTCVATAAGHTSTNVVTHVLTAASLGNFVDNKVAASVPLTQKGAASGVATLDAGGLVPAAQIPAAAQNTVAFAAATTSLTVTAAWQNVTGASVTVACGGTSDVFMVTAVFDVNVTTAGATIFNGMANVDGAALSYYNVAIFGLNSVGRGTVSVVYVVTGLAAGNRAFALQGVKVASLGVATVMQDATTITVLKVRS